MLSFKTFLVALMVCCVDGETIVGVEVKYVHILKNFGEVFLGKNADAWGHCADNQNAENFKDFAKAVQKLDDLMGKGKAKADEENKKNPPSKEKAKKKDEALAADMKANFEAVTVSNEKNPTDEDCTKLANAIAKTIQNHLDEKNGCGSCCITMIIIGILVGIAVIVAVVMMFCKSGNNDDDDDIDM